MTTTGFKLGNTDKANGADIMKAQKKQSGSKPQIDTSLRVKLRLGQQIKPRSE